MMLFFQSCMTKGGASPTQKPLLLIMDGQSNNGGQGETSELPVYLQGQISQRLKIWDGTNISVLEAEVNQGGQMILSAGGQWTSTWHGSELELGYRLTQEYPNRDVLIVKTGRGGRPLGQDGSLDDFSENSTNELHKYMLDNVDDFLTAAGTTLSNYDVWYIWTQGEYDCRTGQDAKANAYETNLTNKMQAVKTDLNNQNINIIINTLSTNQTARDPILLPIVRQAQIDVYSDSAIDNIYGQLSESWTLKTDNLHFNSVGQISKGLGESQIIINK